MFSAQFVLTLRDSLPIVDCCVFRYTSSAQSFVGFFQVLREFCTHFFLLGSTKLQARQPLANDFSPIRHGPPWSASSVRQKAPPIPSAAVTVSSSRQE